MNRKLRNQGFTLIELLVVITIIAILAGLAMPAFVGVQENARITEGSNNCRQVAIFLKQYAADNQGTYPDGDRTEQPQTANDAFRLLVKGGYVQEEKVFLCPISFAKSDGKLGESPDFQDACSAGEVHWCMTKGLSDSSASNAPLVFENPVSNSWPPAWSPQDAGKQVRGRSWTKGRVIIGKNDGSVTTEKLDATTGDNVPLKPNGDGKDIFTMYDEQGEILDILTE
jgi:prepilin-type N-terminal cleavage/methylation domain-containing protein